MTTRVVHVNSSEWAQAVKDGTAVYIGRAVPRRGFKASQWRNPYKISLNESRISVLVKYETMLRQVAHKLTINVFGVTVGLRDKMRTELKGKVLGCWCAPEACHGDLLARLADCTEAEFEHWLATGKIAGWQKESPTEVGQSVS